MPSVVGIASASLRLLRVCCCLLAATVSLCLCSSWPLLLAVLLLRLGASCLIPVLPSIFVLFLLLLFLFLLLLALLVFVLVLFLLCFLFW